MSNSKKKSEPEEWRWVPGHEWYYYVSNRGNVKSRAKNKIIYSAPDKDGYIKCNLYKRGKRKTCRVHHLVARAFLDNPNNCTEINHKDKNKANNHVNNLEWCTHEQNIHAKYGDGWEDINVVDAETCQIVAICYSYTEAEKITNISRRIISKIVGTNKAVKGYRFENGF
jgi:hypothetical protein